MGKQFKMPGVWDKLYLVLTEASPGGYLLLWKTEI